MDQPWQKFTKYYDIFYRLAEFPPVEDATDAEFEEQVRAFLATGHGAKLTKFPGELAPLDAYSDNNYAFEFKYCSWTAKECDRYRQRGLMVDFWKLTAAKHALHLGFRDVYYVYVCGKQSRVYQLSVKKMLSEELLNNFKRWNDKDMGWGVPSCHWTFKGQLP